MGEIPESVREALKTAMCDSPDCPLGCQDCVELAGVVERVLFSADRLGLAAALLERTDHEWRLIETAPKGEEPILAHWINSGTTEIIYRSDTPCDGFEWATDEGAYVSTPTHWMPIPDPPQR